VNRNPVQAVKTNLVAGEAVFKDLGSVITYLQNKVNLVSLNRFHRQYPDQIYLSEEKNFGKQEKQKKHPFTLFHLSSRFPE